MARSTKTFASDITGPWIPKGDIPPVLREFHMARDPLIQAQLRDLAKTESQRREESAGRAKHQGCQQNQKRQSGSSAQAAKTDAPGRGPADLSDRLVP